MISRVKECLAVHPQATVARHYRPLSLVRQVVVHKTSLSAKGPDNPVPIPDEELNVVNLTKSFRAYLGLGTGGWLPYHVLIGTKAQAEQCAPLDLYCAHARQWNHTSIGIAVVGDFDRQPPTPEQWSALVTTVADLVPLNGGLEIVGHTDLPGGSLDPSKHCPGRFLSLAALRVDVARRVNMCEPLELSRQRLLNLGWSVGI